MAVNWSSSCPYSTSEFEDFNPTHLLSLAIRKRRAAFEREDPDFRQELLHTGLVQSLYQYLEEIRARRCRYRRSKISRLLSKSTNRKREWTVNDGPADSENSTTEVVDRAASRISNRGEDAGTSQQNVPYAETVSVKVNEVQKLGHVE